MAHILLVDDTDVVRMSLAQLFRRRGYTVTEAKNPIDAYAMFLQGNYDLVATDINMGTDPDNGLSLCLRVKKVSPQTPVIIMSGDDKQALALQAKADAFVLKSSDVSSIVQAVAALLP